jgi:putative spermidine/putrescine transport system ATP-binding protein
MDQGRVQQVGAPLESYRQPANAFVADFIGTSNLLPGVVGDGGRVRVADHPLRAERLPDGLAKGTKVTVSVRPEDVHVRPAGESGENRLPGTVTFVRDLGASVEITLDCAGHEVMAVTTPRDRPAAGLADAVMVELPAAACVVMAS